MTMHPATESLCGRCRERLALADAEACWYCTGPLCYPCWDAHGHCGHPQADEANRRAAEHYRRTEPRHTLAEAARALGISVNHMRNLARLQLGLRGRGQRVSDRQIEELRTRKTTPGREAQEAEK